MDAISDAAERSSTRGRRTADDDGTAAAQAAAAAATEAALAAGTDAPTDGAPTDGAPQDAPPADDGSQVIEPVMIDGKAVCGFGVPQGTEQDGRVKPTKPCLKDPGHDGEHSSRKYSRLDLSVITDDMLDTLEDVPSDEAGIRFIPLGDRDEKQRKVDDSVLAAHALHTATNADPKKRPQTVQEAIKAGVAKRYFVDLQNVPAVKKMLLLAGEFHEVRVRVDKPRRHTSGRTMLYWFVSDRPSVADETPAPAGNAAENAAEKETAGTAAS